jgi:hypothetical protein
MQHCYANTSLADLRYFQFFFALILLYELAHVYVGFCHPTVTSGEPIVCSDDALPECGLSWENQMFGVRISPSHRCPLSAATFASQFSKPQHTLSTFIPSAYVNQ